MQPRKGLPNDGLTLSEQMALSTLYYKRQLFLIIDHILSDHLSTLSAAYFQCKHIRKVDR
jgi:hypothetical protein